ncbi:MAG TPA: hypothetical protein VK177_15530 [Flavobacteriales bacterium]|nr:hypothetical protein [Flavobacteriales bacterium]
MKSKIQKFNMKAKSGMGKNLIIFSFILGTLAASCGGSKDKTEGETTAGEEKVQAPTMEDEANQYAAKYCEFFNYNNSLLKAQVERELTAEEKKKVDDLMKEFDKFSLEMEKKYAQDTAKGPAFMKIAEEKMKECGAK